MLLDGEATDARQALTEHQVLVQPREVVIEIWVTGIGV